MMIQSDQTKRNKSSKLAGILFGGTGWSEEQSFFLKAAPLIIFVVMLILLFGLIGHRMVLLSNDEGIYLDAAKRVAQGQAPFLDFFYISGPGTPWIMGLCMKVFGVNLPAARLMLIFDIALMTAITFCIARKLGASVHASAMAVFLFVAFSTAQQTGILPNHRWDSGALALLAIYLTWHCREKRSVSKAVLAGLSAVAAAWVTPSMGILAATLFAWFALNRYLRVQIVPFLAGGAMSFAVGLSILFAQGALSAMLDQFIWTFQNYSGANVMSYGQVIGGYSALFQGTSGMTFFVTLCIALIISIPAWLPPSATVGWLIRMRRIRLSSGIYKFEIPFLLTGGWALILAQAPRVDLGHLMFTSPLFYAMSITLVAESFTHTVRRPLLLFFLFAGGLMFQNALTTRFKEIRISTRVGPASASKREAGWLSGFEKYVKRGDSLFVYPYIPIYYFALDGHNPTRYSFLQPGMSSDRDEASALEDLRNNPPEWVIYLNITPESYLRIWPSSDRSRLRMESIEAFIADNYVDCVRIGLYRLKRHRRFLQPDP